ncbi:esterase/lipase family protein [Saccharothrix carnea]|uniref:esterase/lipase family protein n=1 Tax=Saccharothrix TaxID=2071 RepID=UPI00363E861D
MLAGTATAAPARGNTSNNPVIFIHGFDITADTDCTSTWATAENYLRSNGWTGELVTFGYYVGNTNCDVHYGYGLDTPITIIAEDLAWYIYDNYSSKGQKVDVVAHSMGGLIIRMALLKVQLRHGMAQPRPICTSRTSSPSPPRTRAPSPEAHATGCSTTVSARTWSLAAPCSSTWRAWAPAGTATRNCPCRRWAPTGR